MDATLQTQDFIGRTDTQVDQSFQNWLDTARDIRKKLYGLKKDFLLTEYIGRMLDLLGKLPLPEAGMAGFEAAQELYDLCLSIVKGYSGEKDNPFYLTALRYITANPLQLENESVEAALYYARLSAAYLRLAFVKYSDKISAICQEAYPDEIIREHFDRICGLLGEKESMSLLNNLFQRRFFAIPMSQQFYQGEACFFATLLCIDDKDMRKEVFQYLLDDVLPPFSE